MRTIIKCSIQELSKDELKQIVGNGNPSSNTMIWLGSAFMFGGTFLIGSGVYISRKKPFCDNWLVINKATTLNTPNFSIEAGGQGFNYAHVIGSSIETLGVIMLIAGMTLTFGSLKK